MVSTSQTNPKLANYVRVSREKDMMTKDDQNNEKITNMYKCELTYML